MDDVGLTGVDALALIVFIMRSGLMDWKNFPNLIGKVVKIVDNVVPGGNPVKKIVTKRTLISDSRDLTYDFLTFLIFDAGRGVIDYAI